MTANMDRYIKRDDVYALFDKSGMANLHVADIDVIQDADVVPVVRCRECKHHRDKNEQEQQYLVEDILICTSPDATEDCWNAVWPDHFCSYGERKEGAD